MDARKAKDDAAVLFARKKFRKALELYDALVKKEPNNPFVHLRHGDLLARLNQPDLAAEAYQAAALAFRAKGLAPQAGAALKLARRLALSPGQPPA